MSATSITFAFVICWMVSITHSFSLSNVVGINKLSKKTLVTMPLKQLPFRSHSIQFMAPSPIYETAAQLLSVLSDEEEGEEEEAPPPIPMIIEDGSSGVSSIKEGIQFPTSINGTDVRVGIIMSRWNGDIIQGLYKVSR